MSFIQNNWMLILVMLLSGGMLLWPLVQRRLSPMKEIGTLNATHLINHQNAVLLDVRDAKEMQGGKLPNAVHIPLAELDARGAELAKLTKRPIIVYCARGQRARAAGAALTKLGFTDIYQLGGGYRAWKDAGLPVSQIQ
jgi:rhodanese-related sulfurtransferase